MTDNKTSNDLDSVNRENTVQRRKLSYIRSIESEEEIGKQVFQNLPDELKTIMEDKSVYEIKIAGLSKVFAVHRDNTTVEHNFDMDENKIQQVFETLAYNSDDQLDGEKLSNQDHYSFSAMMRICDFRFTANKYSRKHKNYHASIRLNDDTAYPLETYGLTKEQAEFLKKKIQIPLSCIVVGQPASGKTSFLNSLLEDATIWMYIVGDIIDIAPRGMPYIEDMIVNADQSADRVFMNLKRISHDLIILSEVGGKVADLVFLCLNAGMKLITSMHAANLNSVHESLHTQLESAGILRDFDRVKNVIDEHIDLLIFIDSSRKVKKIKINNYSLWKEAFNIFSPEILERHPLSDDKSISMPTVKSSLVHSNEEVKGDTYRVSQALNSRLNYMFTEAKTLRFFETLVDLDCQIDLHFCSSSESILDYLSQFSPKSLLHSNNFDELLDHVSKEPKQLIPTACFQVESTEDDETIVYLTHGKVIGKDDDRDSESGVIKGIIRVYDCDNLLKIFSLRKVIGDRGVSLDKIVSVINFKSNNPLVSHKDIMKKFSINQSMFTKLFANTNIVSKS